jgi:rRNA-processing protein FCF1
MAFIDDVKTALRRSHTKLDGEIQAAINASKKEMSRAGILPTAIVETDELIAMAIKTYCQYVFASDEKIREAFFNSWEYQLDNLRKSAGYGFEVVEDV